MSDPATVPQGPNGNGINPPGDPKVKPDGSTWIETFVADGAANSFDAKNPDYSTLSWQSGSLAANRHPRDQQTAFWIADNVSFLPPYVYESAAVPVAAVLRPQRQHAAVLLGRAHVPGR